MANKLKIYACSGIGDVNGKPKGYDYWTDNTSSIRNTQAVNTLLALINLNNSEVINLRMPQAEQIDKLNNIDFLVVCLDAAQRYAGSDEQLYKAGLAIGKMCDERLFDYVSTDNTERDKHLDGLLETFEYYVQSGKTGGNDQFGEWWQEHVQSRNKVGLTSAEQDAVQEAISEGISGIGASELNWQDNAELSKYLNKASEYFLYLYFTEAQLAKLPRRFKTKKNYQQQVYNYCKGLFIKQFGSETEMQNIIRAGIVGYFKQQPEELCEAISNQKYNGAIGPVTVDIVIGIKELIMIIAIVAGTMIAIVSAICAAVTKSKTAKYAAVDQQIIDAAGADAEDFESMEGYDELGLGKKSNWFTFGLIAIGLLLLTKR